ncbi:tripartite tricarboxylate transporter TctB family protein [Desulfitobacterium sp. AusDCA]|uniref:tripartite tricarboxylate transporter TctB family protein n=1 Tax=Desulfitobacterium sp. AusDCA TaxID=3240383 RepID=UPI003DA73640
MTRISPTAKGSLGISLVTLLFLAEAIKLPFGTIQEPQSGFMPVVVGVALLVLSLTLAGREIFFTTKQIEQDSIKEPEQPKAKSLLTKPFILGICIFVYPFILDRLGFVVSTIPLLYISLRVMKYRSWLSSVIISIVTVGVLYYIFTNWFGVFLPEGILF